MDTGHARLRRGLADEISQLLQEDLELQHAREALRLLDDEPDHTAVRAVVAALASRASAPGAILNEPARRLILSADGNPRVADGAQLLAALPSQIISDDEP